MQSGRYAFDYQLYESPDQLSEADRELFHAALEATALAYAPYSRFAVGAAARLRGGAVVKAGNLENAAFPAGLCAEQAALANCAAQYPGEPLEALAIRYRREDGFNNHPISPCGVCRQAMQEFALRTGQSFRLLLQDRGGSVLLIPDARDLLPLAFRF